MGIREETFNRIARKNMGTQQQGETMSRFNYVKYDNAATVDQEEAKDLCGKLEHLIESMGPGRAQSLALTKLEETYMWIGKAIRDEQIKRGGSAEHIAERTNS